MKKDKEDVQYSKGMPHTECSLCKHYITGGTCRLVKGKINPRYWCKLFRRK